MHVRRLATVSAIVLATLACRSVHARMGALEAATDRWGSDYYEFRAPSAEACRTHCNTEEKCLAMTFLQDPDRPGGTCFLKKQVPTTSLRPEAMSAIKLAAAARPLADAGSCIMSGRLSGDLQWAKRVVASDGTGTERGADVDKGRYSLTLPAGRHTVVVSAGKMSVVTTPPAREVDCTGAPIQGDFRIDRYDEG